MTEEDMLPCPFCGSKATLWPMTQGRVSPYCEWCGAAFIGGALDDSVEDKDGNFASDASTAVAYWNRRVTPNAK